MTKLQHAQKHISLREDWFEVRFNVFHKAYALLHMMFVREDSIVGANNTLELYIRDYGTAKNLRHQLAEV